MTGSPVTITVDRSTRARQCRATSGHRREHDEMLPRRVVVLVAALVAAVAADESSAPTRLPTPVPSPLPTPLPTPLAAASKKKKRASGAPVAAKIRHARQRRRAGRFT